MNIPRLVIAGAQSGVGKTSLTLGLVTLLRRRNLRVQTFKVGPDYLDPTWLAEASGRPCYNLDGWMTGRSYAEELFARATRNADLAVIEGVMGLFDGADPVSLEGSTAEIAIWLKAPVLLVLNARGMSRSIAAMVHGYHHFNKDLPLAGVIANQCGSEHHADGIAKSLKGADLPRLLGAIPRGKLPVISSRHLGLVTAKTAGITPSFLDDLADAMEPCLSFENIVQTARKAPPLRETNSETSPAFGLPFSACLKPRLGIAKDDAFHFYYPDNLEKLQEAGCELIPFSPLNDSSLPRGLNGIYFGGGYPEEYAQPLSENKGMIGEIRRFAENGVIYGECGGLMYLSEGIETLDGSRHSQVGLLPVWTQMRKGRPPLGYVEITLKRGTLWGKDGDQLRGHEFHYSHLMGDPTSGGNWECAYEVRRRRSDQTFQEGFQKKGILATYTHAHFASRPAAVREFVHRLAESRERMMAA